MRAVGLNEPPAGGTWMWAGARPAPASGAGCLHWLVSTTFRLHKYCSAARNQMALSWPHSSPIFGPNPAFWVNYMIITCFPSLLPSLLLIRPSLLHSLLRCYYYIITYYSGNNVSIITHYYICYYPIITHYCICSYIIITYYYQVIISNLLPITRVIMDPLLPIITRSTTGNNGSTITYY